VLSVYVYREIFKLEGITGFYAERPIFFRDDTARSTVRSGDENRPTTSPAGIEKSRTLAFFFAQRAASPYCFYEVMQAAAAEFDEIGTKPVTPKSMAPPWIDLTALFDSLLLRVHVFVYVCR